MDVDVGTVIVLAFRPSPPTFACSMDGRVRNCR